MGSVRTGPAPRANTVGGISMRLRTQLAVVGLVASALAVGLAFRRRARGRRRLGGDDRRPRRRLVRSGSGAHGDRRRRRNRHARAGARGSRAPDDADRSSSSATPTSSAGARPRTPRTCRAPKRRSGVRRGSIPPTRSRDRARVARAHPTRLSRGARDRKARRAPRPVERADIRPRRGCPARVGRYRTPSARSSA